MKTYIAGPMTGIPQFNFPAFDAAAADLRVRGFEVVNPAELDDPEHRALALGSATGSLEDAGFMDAQVHMTWGDFLARDVKLIADGDFEVVHVLPGWAASRGARLETFVARLCGIPIVDYAKRRYVPLIELLVAWDKMPPIKVTQQGMLVNGQPEVRQ